MPTPLARLGGRLQSTDLIEYGRGSDEIARALFWGVPATTGNLASATAAVYVSASAGVFSAASTLASTAAAVWTGAAAGNFSAAGRLAPITVTIAMTGLAGPLAGAGRLDSASADVWASGEAGALIGLMTGSVPGRASAFDYALYHASSSARAFSASASDRARGADSADRAADVSVLETVYGADSAEA